MPHFAAANEKVPRTYTYAYIYVCVCVCVHTAYPLAKATDFLGVAEYVLCRSEREGAEQAGESEFVALEHEAD